MIHHHDDHCASLSVRVAAASGRARRRGRRRRSVRPARAAAGATITETRTAAAPGPQRPRRSTHVQTESSCAIIIMPRPRFSSHHASVIINLNSTSSDLTVAARSCQPAQRHGHGRRGSHSNLKFDCGQSRSLAVPRTVTPSRRWRVTATSDRPIQLPRQVLNASDSDGPWP